jgi:hypothetical protein
MNKNFLILLTCSIYFTLNSCHPKTIPAGNENNQQEVLSGKILFLAYEVIKDSVSGNISTKILYQKLAEGFVKPGTILQAEPTPGNWQVIIAGSRDSETIFIENPLHKHMEYVGADGALGTREVWLSRAEIVVRTNYKKSMARVELQEIGTNKKNRTIFTHSITLKDN